MRREPSRCRLRFVGFCGGGTSQEKQVVSPLVRFEAATDIARSRSRARLPTPEELDAAEASVDGFCEKIEATDISISAAIGGTVLNFVP